MTISSCAIVLHLSHWSCADTRTARPGLREVVAVQSDDPAIQTLRFPPGAPLWEWSADQPSAGAAALSSTLLVYMPSTRLVGQVDPSRRRLSDYLNDPSRNYLELANVTI